LSNIEVRFNDNFKEKLPYCKIKVTSDDDSIVIGSYEMTFDDFVESIIDSNMQVLKPLRVIGVKKLNTPVRIRGRKKYKNNAQSFETPILPQNCLKYINRPAGYRTVNAVNQSGESVSLKMKSYEQVIFIEVPKKRFDISYYNSEMKDVGFPRLIFGYVIKDQRIQSIYLFAIKDGGRIKDSTMLYKFPYANVIQGKVCMGSNSLPTIKEIAQLGSMHNLFFAAPSSSCYFNGSRNASGINDLRDLYNRMSGQDFPEDWLESKEITFGQFCNNLLK